MTRRGSLVYYLSAWVIGCFVFSLLPWVRAMGAIDSGVSGNLLFVYFITLIAGAPDILIFAFLLRTILKWITPAGRAGATQMVWVWAVVAAILSFAMTYLLAWAELASRRVPGFDQGALHVVYQFFLVGPRALRDSRPAVVAGAGALVGVVLFLVDRAFEPREAASEETPRG